MSEAEDIRGPGVPISPVWIALFVFGGSYVIGYYFPNHIINGEISLKFVGYILMALSLYVMLDGNIRLNKANTNVPPWKPTNAIVKTGVYRFTRNPLYLSLWLLQIGLGLVLDNAAIVTGSFFFLLITWWVAVRKEEEYLEKKFGEEYLAYKKRVRRWM